MTWKWGHLFHWVFSPLPRRCYKRITAPLCELSCVFSSLKSLLNSLPQLLHEQCFSPEWTHWCIISLASHQKAFHFPQNILQAFHSHQLYSDSLTQEHFPLCCCDFCFRHVSFSTALLLEMMPSLQTCFFSFFGSLVWGIFQTGSGYSFALHLCERVLCK